MNGLWPDLHGNSRGMPVFVLDSFRSAFNVGSAFRTAEAVSPAAVFLTGTCAVPGNRKLAHTARGTQDEVPWRYFPRSPEAVAWLAATGRRIVAVEGGPGSVPLFDAPFETGDAFVFGSEALGIDPGVESSADLRICFPQSGRRRCMNVSSILALVAAEIQRRRLLAGMLHAGPSTDSGNLEET